MQHKLHFVHFQRFFHIVWSQYIKSFPRFLILIFSYVIATSQINFPLHQFVPFDR